jgi:hypothetical protein
MNFHPLPGIRVEALTGIRSAIDYDQMSKRR